MRVEPAHAVGTTQRDISLSTDPLDSALQWAPVFALFREAPVVEITLRRRRMRDGFAASPNGYTNSAAG